MTRPTILYVDDEATNLRGFARLFKSTWTIFVAGSAEEALALLRKQSVAVVLADQVMPGMSGTELLAQVTEIYPDTLRCVVSGYAQSGEILDAMKAGHVHHFFAKPWDPADLQRTLESALERATLERERQRLLEELQVAEGRLQQEATHFRALLEAAPDALVIADENGLITAVNGAFEELFGYARAEVIGGPMKLLLPERYEEDHAPLRTSVVEDPRRRVSREDVLAKRKDGSELDVDIALSPLATDDGVLVITAIRDVTERRRAEAEIHALNEELEARVEARTEALACANAELWESENHFRHLFEESRDAIILRSEEGLIDCNERALEMFGCVSKEEFVGLRPEQLSPPLQPDGRPSLEASLEHIAACLEEGGMLFEWVHRRRDAMDFPCEVQLSSVVWGEARIVQAAVRDITERKRTEEAIRRARDAAESANRAKSAFIAGMSHEIRTPMNAVLGFTRLLQHDASLAPEHRGMVDQIGRSGEHLLTLINAVLEMSKIDAGRVEIERRAFDLPATVRDLELSFRARVEEAGLRFSVVAQDLPRVVATDEVKLRHILVNLLGNALKFTARGSIELRAWTTSQEAGLRLGVDVEDTGEGIAREDTERVFEKFGQTEQGRNRGGTGLGLATSREYARLLGGDLTVRSEAGRGSCFHLEVPIELVHHALRAPGSTAGGIEGFRPDWSEPGEPGDPVAAGAPHHGLPEAIGALPPSLVARLREATGNGDFDRLIALIDATNEEHPEIAEGLRHLANAFEYDRLLLLLEPGRSET